MEHTVCCNARTLYSHVSPICQLITLSIVSITLIWQLMYTFLCDVCYDIKLAVSFLDVLVLQVKLG